LTSWAHRSSDGASPPRAVIDTDVIYSRVLHELIGRLAYQERLLTLIWSDQLLNEAKRILLERKPVPEQAAAGDRLCLTPAVLIKLTASLEQPSIATLKPERR
jgi:hypothetical protein